MSLLNTYEEMIKEATDFEETNERVDFLVKVAAYAEELLEAEYQEDYSAEDVEKLAGALIEMQLEHEEEVEKVAELDEAGRIMARAFMSELED